MTIAGTAYRSCYPCAGCGAEGEQVWLAAESLLCYDCRHMPSTALVIDAQFEKEIRPHAEAVAEYLSPDARAYVIADNEGFVEAGEIINELKRRLKELDAIEKTATRPMLQSLDTVRGWFRPEKDRVHQAREIWDGKIKEYLAEQAANQAEVQKQLQAAATAGNRQEMQASLAKLEPAPQAKGVSVRQVWRWRVVDKALVPAEFLVVDETKVNAEMRRAGDTPSIPGIEFWQEATIAATGR